MEQCQILGRYAIYAARDWRQYPKYMQLETAVKKAVDECILGGMTIEEFLFGKIERRLMAAVEYIRI